MFKKLKWMGLLLTLLFFVNVNTALAAGVPVYQYNVSQGSASGYVSTSYYDWNDGGWPWRYYYKVFLYSPGLPSGYYYAGTLSLKAACGQFYIQAFNGSAWVNISQINTWDGYNEYWRTLDFDIALPYPIQQLRYVTYVASFYGESRSHSCSVGSTTYRVHLLGADQDTVTQARDAANAANSNAWNAYVRANDAANLAWQVADWLNPASGSASAVKDSSGTVLTVARNAANNTWYNGQSAAYWANLAAANIAPVINKVQGQNGATCTTGTTFTLVISVTPSSGVSYRVTCGSFDSGWTTNNTITITGLTTAGAKTATVQVRNTAGNIAQTTFTFFKV